VIIAVIDGMGGGIGAHIVTLLRQELPLDVESTQQADPHRKDRLSAAHRPSEPTT
jgi:hypothetical protein